MRRLLRRTDGGAVRGRRDEHLLDGRRRRGDLRPEGAPVRHAASAGRRGGARRARDLGGRLAVERPVADRAGPGTGDADGDAMRIGTREEWLAARKELLGEEKELTRRSDELARNRRELPWVRVEKEYEFDTDEATKKLAELFEGRSQLLVYHFMFGPSVEGWPEAGCPGCTYTADSPTRSTAPSRT